jgi:hypothetical protein
MTVQALVSWNMHSVTLGNLKVILFFPSTGSPSKIKPKFPYQQPGQESCSALLLENQVGQQCETNTRGNITEIPEEVYIN